jgi:hypothetical protein
MAELLDRIQAEIRERMLERQPAMDEYERLLAALAALEARPAGPAPPLEEAA